LTHLIPVQAVESGRPELLRHGEFSAPEDSLRRIWLQHDEHGTSENERRADVGRFHGCSAAYVRNGVDCCKAVSPDLKKREKGKEKGSLLQLRRARKKAERSVTIA